MDVLLRNIDVVAVNKIDQEAKKVGMSRNEFLRRHLEKFAHYNVFVEERKEFEKQSNKNMNVMEAFLKAQEELYKKVERFEAIVLLLMDADEEEVNDMLVMVGCDEND